MGRGSRGRRTAGPGALRPVPPDGAPPALSGRRRSPPRAGSRVSLLLHPGGARRGSGRPGGSAPAAAVRRSLRPPHRGPASRAGGRGATARHPLPDPARDGRLRRHRAGPRRDRGRRAGRRPGDRALRRDSPVPLHGGRRRCRDGDHPRHPRRGSPVQHPQAHPAVPRTGRGRARLRAPAADPEPRPHQDEQAQVADGDRRLPRPGLRARGAGQLPRAAGVGQRHRGGDLHARPTGGAVRPGARALRRGHLRSRAAGVAERPVDPPPAHGGPRRTAGAVPLRRAGTAYGERRTPGASADRGRHASAHAAGAGTAAGPGRHRRPGRLPVHRSDPRRAGAAGAEAVGRGDHGGGARVGPRRHRRPGPGELRGGRARGAAARAGRGARLEGGRPVHGDPGGHHRPDRHAAAVRHNGRAGPGANARAAGRRRRDASGAAAAPA